MSGSRQLLNKNGSSQTWLEKKC